MKKLTAIWRETRGVRRGIAGNALCGILAVGLSLTVVALTREIVSAACDGNVTTVGRLAVALCLAMVVRLLANRFGARLDAWCITRFSNRMRSDLFGRIMNHCAEVDHGLHSADAVNRLSVDVAAVSAAACSTFPSMVVSACSLVGSFVFLVILAPAVAVVVTLLMPVAILAGKGFTGRTTRLTRQIREEETGIYRMMQENISHRVLVSTLGYTSEAEAGFRERQDRFFGLTMRRNDLSLWSGGAVSFGFMAGYAVMFLYCAYGLADGTVSFATMTALLQLAAMVQRPAVELSGKITPLIRAGVSMDRIEEIRQIYGSECDRSSAPLLTTPDISIDHVTFAYGADSDLVFRDFNETIPTGKITSIYGTTGSGKTTLLKLLLGLRRPQSGRIGTPFPIADGHVVYVPQGNTLLSGTILSNLLMGNPEVTEAEIREALHLSAADFVNDLPDGLNTVCGELGHGLSEGQAQRIALARGLIRLMDLRRRNPGQTLLLLDEPTSALDTATEELLCNRLFPSLKDTTVIIITHKSIPGQHSDKTIVLTPPA